MNDDLFDDTELDRWLRDNAGRYNRTPAPDGWDTPSNAVWEGLRAGLDRRKKRRRYGWLWLFLFCGLFAGGLIAYRQMPAQAQRTGQQTQATQPPPSGERPSVPAFDPQANTRPAVAAPLTAGRPLAGNRLKRPSAPEAPACLAVPTNNPPAPAQAPVSSPETPTLPFPAPGRLPQHSIPLSRTADLRPEPDFKDITVRRFSPSPGAEGNPDSSKILILVRGMSRFRQCSASIWLNSSFAIDSL